MKKINSFTFITLNGFFKGLNEDIGWHEHGQEGSEYAQKGLSSNNILLFGRKTYEMMSSWWPTPEAVKSDPAVAHGMNNSEKIVFSRTLKEAKWNNTRIIKDNIVEEIRKLKERGDKDMTILGSGSILSLLADNGLIDEFQFLIDPIALGEGTPVLNGIRTKLELRMTKYQSFKSGSMLHIYEPK